MTNVLKLTKKVFTVGVVATTIVWSLGVAALVPTVANAATCPTLAAGDMIKVSGKPAIYVVDNNLKPRYFDNGDVFKSWTPTYTGYKTITMECLDSLGNPAVAPYGVSYKPGSYVVKRSSSDQLYVVEPNNTLATITTEAAKALYGSDFNKVIGTYTATKEPMYKRLMVISVQDWPNYVNRGTAITEGVAHEGMIVSNGGTNWYIGAGTKQEVTATGLTANGFQSKFISAVASSALTGLTTGTAITAEVKTITDKSQSGGVTTVTTPTTGTVSISLASGTPAATSVPKNGSRVPFTTVNLTAGSNGATVDSLLIKRTGLSASTDFLRIWAEKSGTRVSSQQTLNSSDEATLTFSPALVLTAGQTVTLEIIASLNNASNTNAALGVSTVSGSYVFGNLMTFAAYTVGTFTFTPAAATTTVKVGDTGINLTSFEITAPSDKDVYFKSIMLKNTGTEDMTKTLANVYLEKSGAAVSDAGVINGRYVTFNLIGGGLLIEKGDTFTFKVKSDIITKENTSDHALSLTLNKSEDITVVEKTTGFGCSFTFTSAITVGNTDYDAGVVTITKKSTSPSDRDSIKGEKQVVALIANIKADETITAEGLNLVATTSNGFGYFENAKVTLNGYSLGTVTPAATMAFDSAFTLNKGDNELKVFVDVATNATSSANIRFSIDGTTVLSGMSPEYTNGNVVGASDINGSPVGAYITVQGADLTVSKNDGYTDTKTIVRGATQTVLAKFNVKALYDNVKITSIEVTPGTQADYIAQSAVTNMGIFADGSQVGTTRPYTSPTFANVNYTINKDTTKPFEVRADFDSTSTGTIKFTVKFNFEDSRSKTGEKTGTTSLITVAAAGTLSISADASKPDAGIVLAKAGVENTLAAWKISALKDSANITQLIFDNSGTTTPDSRVSSYKLYKGTTLIGTENPTSGTTTFKITDDKLKIAANTSEVITLKAIFNTIEDRANTAAQFRARLQDVDFKNSSGTEDTGTYINLELACNTMELRKTVPTFAAVTPAAGEMLKFTVTADTNEDVVLTKLAFVATGSGAASTTGYTLWDGNTNVSSTLSGTTTPTFDGLSITIGKGLTKTITLKADTADVTKDLKVLMTFDRGASGANIGWEEVFVDGGNVAATGALLNLLPITYEKTY